MLKSYSNIITLILIKYIDYSLPLFTFLNLASLDLASLNLASLDLTSAVLALARSSRWSTTVPRFRGMSLGKTLYGTFPAWRFWQAVQISVIYLLN